MHWLVFALLLEANIILAAFNYFVLGNGLAAAISACVSSFVLGIGVTTFMWTRRP